MNLASTVSIHAGGQGSGCHGDSCGRPTITLYHGTSHKAIKGITKEGLRTSASIRRGGGKITDQITRLGINRGFVYLTKDPKLALSYARSRVAAVGGKPAVVRVEYPKDKKYNLDKDRFQKGAFNHLGNIPAKYVHSVKVKSK